MTVSVKQDFVDLAQASKESGLPQSLLFKLATARMIRFEFHDESGTLFVSMSSIRDVIREARETKGDGRNVKR